MNESPYVLIVSPNAPLRAELAAGLGPHGVSIDTACGYAAMLNSLHVRPADGIILHVPLGRGNRSPGLAEARRWLARAILEPEPVYLRERGHRLPEDLKAHAIRLPAGRELLVAAVLDRLRRDGFSLAPRPFDDGLSLDCETRWLHGPNGTVPLTPVQAALLAHLRAHPWEWLSPEALLREVWRYEHSQDASILVRAHMSNLRGKLRRAGVRDVGDEYGGLIRTLRARPQRRSGDGLRLLPPVPGAYRYDPVPVAAAAAYVRCDRCAKRVDERDAVGVVDRLTQATRWFCGDVRCRSQIAAHEARPAVRLL